MVQNVETQTSPPAILRSLLAVAAAMSIAGIGKDRENTHQKFKFRGIDDVLNALSPEWVSNNVIVAPRLISQEQMERKTDKGGVLLFATVIMEYDFTSTVDGSKVTVRMPGQAMDSGDKAMNKAISVAYKYAVIQLLSIPIEGTPEDRDPDFTTHKLGAEREPAPRAPIEPKKWEPKKESVEPETISDAIERMTNSEVARNKLTELLVKSYSVMTVDQIPAERVQEAIEQARVCLEKQRNRKAGVKS